jgi:Family of unknown function (DUF6624)
MFAAVAGALGCSAGVAPPEHAPPDSVATMPVLRGRLLRMGLLDQTVRLGFTASAIESDTVFARASVAIDSILTRRLRVVIDSVGWPTRAMVGPQAASSAFLIVQHSPSDVFQRQSLPALQAAARANEASASDVAMLTDRILTHDGKPQIYGTQFRIVDGELIPYPIERIDDLDRRRAAAGLMPMAEYAQLLEQTYDGPVRWPPDTTR